MGIHVLIFASIIADVGRSDGFALNVGPEDWVKDCVSMCFEAMSRTKVSFKSFFSFDMACVDIHLYISIFLRERFPNLTTILVVPSREIRRKTSKYYAITWNRSPTTLICIDKTVKS